MSKQTHENSPGKGRRKYKTSRRSRRNHNHQQVSTTDTDNNPASNLGTGSQISSTTAAAAIASATATSQNKNDDYQLLLSPMFAAMTKISNHLFLTGVGGMTRENFRKNHIDFVVNITTEAPFWEDVESMRLPLEDDNSTNILPYMDTAVDRINEVISKKNGHVLVHCIAGVSRSATVVIGYLMKYKKMDLRSAFNYCYKLRPVIRPNNGFMMQLINYETHLFGKSSVYMVEADVDGIIVNVPHFFIEEHPRLVLLEVMRAKDNSQKVSSSSSLGAATTTTATTTTTTTTTGTTTTPLATTTTTTTQSNVVGNNPSSNLNEET